jgi:hypothetical protein
MIKKLWSALIEFFMAFGGVTRKPARARRICRNCQKPIRRRDKYRFVGSEVQHRDCDQPQGVPAAESTQPPLMLGGRDDG